MWKQSGRKEDFFSPFPPVTTPDPSLRRDKKTSVEIKIWPIYYPAKSGKADEVPTQRWSLQKKWNHDTSASLVEHKTCDILPAERLRLMIFYSRLIIDSFQKKKHMCTQMVIFHKWEIQNGENTSWCTWRSWAGRGGGHIQDKPVRGKHESQRRPPLHCIWSGAEPLRQGKGQLFPLFSAFWPLLHFFVYSRNKNVKDSLLWTLLLHRRLCFLLMASLEASLI